MKAAAFILLVLSIVESTHGQDQARYDELVTKAFAQYEQKEFRASGATYSSAFEVLGWKGTSTDRYNAACSWALAGVADSAFFQLRLIAERMDYANLAHITKDSDLNSLHPDERWTAVIAMIEANKERLEANYDKPLVALLDSIFAVDQGLRNQIPELEARFERGSEELKAHFHRIWIADSLNQIKVTRVLDERGWLGPDVIGPTGNTTLFLVVQHADLETQLKYVPMIREAVKKGAAKGSHLALMEDRILLRSGKRQIYGSQVGSDPETGAHYLSPLEDPDHVDERRASVGLPPLATYLQRMGVIWDVEAYKKQLPDLERKLEQDSQK